MTSNVLYCSIISIRHFPDKFKTFWNIQKVHATLYYSFVASQSRYTALLFIMLHSFVPMVYLIPMGYFINSLEGYGSLNAERKKNKQVCSPLPCTSTHKPLLRAHISLAYSSSAHVFCFLASCNFVFSRDSKGCCQGGRGSIFLFIYLHTYLFFCDLVSINNLKQLPSG